MLELTVPIDKLLGVLNESCGVHDEELIEQAEGACAIVQGKIYKNSKKEAGERYRLWRQAHEEARKEFSGKQLRIIEAEGRKGRANRRIDAKRDFTIPVEEMTEIAEEMESGASKVPPPMDFDDEKEVASIAVPWMTLFDRQLKRFMPGVLDMECLESLGCPARAQMHIEADYRERIVPDPLAGVEAPKGRQSTPRPPDSEEGHRRYIAAFRTFTGSLKELRAPWITKVSVYDPIHTDETAFRILEGEIIEDLMHALNGINNTKIIMQCHCPRYRVVMQENVKDAQQQKSKAVEAMMKSYKDARESMRRYPDPDTVKLIVELRDAVERLQAKKRSGEPVQDAATLEGTVRGVTARNRGNRMEDAKEAEAVNPAVLLVHEANQKEYQGKYDGTLGTYVVVTLIPFLDASQFERLSLIHI